MRGSTWRPIFCCVEIKDFQTIILYNSTISAFYPVRGGSLSCFILYVYFPYIAMEMCTGGFATVVKIKHAAVSLQAYYHILSCTSTTYYYYIHIRKYALLQSGCYSIYSLRRSALQLSTLYTEKKRTDFFLPLSSRAVYIYIV